MDALYYFPKVSGPCVFEPLVRYLLLRYSRVGTEKALNFTDNFTVNLYTHLPYDGWVGHKKYFPFI